MNETILETMRRGDNALYEAKRSGRDRGVAARPQPAEPTPAELQGGLSGSARRKRVR